MTQQEQIEAFVSQARLRLSQLAEEFSRLGSSGKNNKKIGRQLLVLRLAIKATEDPIDFDSLSRIMEAARSYTGIGFSFPVLSQLKDCSDCTPLSVGTGIALPIGSDDVLYNDPSLGMVTLTQTLNNLYQLLQTVVWEPIPTSKGRDFNYPAERPLDTYHNYPTLMDYVRAHIFPYSGPQGTFTSNKAGQIFKVGDVIPSVILSLTHAQSSLGIAAKRIYDTSASLNSLLKEELLGALNNPTLHELTNLVLGNQYESRTNGRLSKEYKGTLRDSVSGDQGGTELSLFTYIDFVYPQFFLKTATDLSTPTAQQAGDAIKAAAPIIAMKGTYRTGNMPQQVDFQNEYAVFAWPDSYGPLSKIGQEADSFQANYLNTMSWRNGAYFPATITYVGADGITYSQPYRFYISQEKLTAPNNFEFK